MLDDLIVENMDTKEERLICGKELMIFSECPCIEVQDDVFHNYFRKIDWSLPNLKYLNKVQDQWSIYCQNMFGNQLTPYDKLQKKFGSEDFIIDFLSELYDEINKCERFYQKKRKEIIDEFISLQV